MCWLSAGSYLFSCAKGRTVKYFNRIVLVHDCISQIPWNRCTEQKECLFFYMPTLMIISSLTSACADGGVGESSDAMAATMATNPTQIHRRSRKISALWCRLRFKYTKKVIVQESAKSESRSRTAKLWRRYRVGWLKARTHLLPTHWRNRARAAVVEMTQRYPLLPCEVVWMDEEVDCAAFCRHRCRINGNSCVAKTKKIIPSRQSMNVKLEKDVGMKKKQQVLSVWF